MPFWKSKSAEASEQKSQLSDCQPLVSLNFGGAASWGGRDYGSLARAGYQSNAVVYRCVRMIAEAAASVPLCVRRGGECQPGDPAAALLAKGHPGATPTEILERFYGFLQVSGNGYLEAALVDGSPAALYALRPDRVSQLTGKDGWPVGFEYAAEVRAKRYVRDPASGRCAVYHMHLFNPASDVSGFSPLAAAAKAVDIHNEGGQWTKSLLDNSARPSGALILNGNAGTMTDKQYARLKGQLEDMHAGAGQAGRPMLLEGGMEWRAMSFSPSDMDFIAARREAAREIALAFGIPPMLLGIPGDNTYANYKEANLAFWRQAVIPLVTKTARGLTDWLSPYFGEDLQILPELDSVPALSEERAALWARLTAATFLTDDERRQMAGLEIKNMEAVNG